MMGTESDSMHWINLNVGERTAVEVLQDPPTLHLVPDERSETCKRVNKNDSERYRAIVLLHKYACNEPEVHEYLVSVGFLPNHKIDEVRRARIKFLQAELDREMGCLNNVGISNENR